MTVQLLILGEKFGMVGSEKERTQNFEIKTADSRSYIKAEVQADSSTRKDASAARLNELTQSLHILVVDLG